MRATIRSEHRRTLDHERVATVRGADRGLRGCVPVTADHFARHTLDNATIVCFEVDPPPGYRSAAAADVVAQVRAAVAPALG
jgi:hypothetical protein